MANKASKEDVNTVFAAWMAGQKRPHLCKLTSGRENLIKRALREYSALEISTLMRYAYESSDERARFWRGENDRNETYLDLTNLLRITKLDERVLLAMTWAEDALESESPTTRAESPLSNALPFASAPRPRTNPTVAPGDEVPAETRSFRSALSRRTG